MSYRTYTEYYDDTDLIIEACGKENLNGGALIFSDEEVFILFNTLRYFMYEAPGEPTDKLLRLYKSMCDHYYLQVHGELPPKEPHTNA